MTNKELKAAVNLLKTYFTENFMGSVIGGGCETCGYGGIMGMTLEDITETLDRFLMQVKTDKEMQGILKLKKD